MSTKIDRVPRCTPPDPEFRAEVAAQFARYMRAKALTLTAAADQLGVRKQTLSKYLKARITPGSEVLARACARWGLSFKYRGIVISARDFPPSARVPEVTPQQLHFFFDSPYELQGPGENLSVKIERPQPEIVELRIKFRIAS